MPDFLISLMVLAVATTITPGPSTLLAAASGVRYGLFRSLPLAAGVAVGLALLTAAGAFSLSTLLQTAPSLQFAIKILGSGYLVWLAWRIFRSGAPSASENAGGERAMGFVTGLAVLFLAPKAWMMGLAAAGAYAEFTSSSLELALLLAASFGCAAMGAMVLWCLGGAALGRVLKTDAQWSTVNLVLSIVTVISVATVWF
ncbi:MAG: LysE family translocator [Alphaproteobacteria bacterium]|nr:LysE family translocator [Alphaproteobacteria bacterium]